MKFSVKTTLRCLAFVSGLFALGAAQAHHAWIEQDAQGAKFFFGEFGENQREVSPGLLDKFPGPVAHRVGARGAEPVAVSKAAGSFALAARAGKGESIVAQETAYPSWQQPSQGATVRGVYLPAARYAGDLSQQAPYLPLDLVPTGRNDKDSVEVQAFYKNKPLPKTKVMVVTAAGWSQEHLTDDAGKLTVKLPWSGTYVLEMSHKDRTPGERPGEKYDFADYVTSLTVTQPAGLAPLPPPAPAAPGK